MSDPEVPVIYKETYNEAFRGVLSNLVLLVFSSSNLNVSGISILNNGIVQRLLILVRFGNQSLTKMVTS